MYIYKNIYNYPALQIMFYVVISRGETMVHSRTDPALNITKYSILRRKMDQILLYVENGQWKMLPRSQSHRPTRFCFFMFCFTLKFQVK